MNVLSNLKFNASSLVLDYLTEFPSTPAPGQMSLVNGAIYVYTDLGGITSWYPLTNEKNYLVYVQGVEATEWIVNHDLGTSDFIFFSYDENQNLMQGSYEFIDNNSFKIVFSSAKKGRLIVFFAVDAQGTAVQNDSYTKAEVDTKLALKLELQDIVDNLTSNLSNKALSAKQGYILKGLIDTINTLLLSNDGTLDTLQEVVEYIKLNKATLDTLSISSIIGLQTALDSLQSAINDKADLNSPIFTTPNIGVATGTSFNDITGLATATPLANGTAAVGTSTKAAREDHIHTGGGGGVPDTGAVFIGDVAFGTSGRIIKCYGPGNIYSNIAIGDMSLNANTTGGHNVAIGVNALSSNTEGTNNTAVGSQTMTTMIGSAGNTAVGSQAMKGISGGNFNTAVGYRSLYGNAGGTDNTALGINTLQNNTTGNANTALGINALRYNTEGTNNIALGNNTLQNNTTGNANIMIGAMTSGHGNAPVFDITTESDYISMGSTAVTNAYIKVAWTVTSDKRDKGNITDLTQGLDFVNKLKPVSYQFKLDREHEETDGITRYGFLAQDILEVEGENPVLVDNQHEDKFHLRESNMFAILTKSVQELSILADKQSKEIEELKAMIVSLMSKS